MKGKYDVESINRMIEKGKDEGKLLMSEVDTVFEKVSFNVELIEYFYEKCKELNIEVIEDKSGKEDSDAFDVDETVEEISMYSDGNYDAVKIYLNDTRRYPLLTPEEEQEYGRLALEGTPEQARMAKTKLAESNLRLVISKAKEYVRKSNEPFLDIIQAGNLGLMKAVEMFDYRKGFRFSTYATWWIKQSIVRSNYENSRTIRIPVAAMEKIEKIRRFRAEFLEKYQREPSFQEIGNQLGISDKKVKELLANSQDMVSLDSPIRADEDNDTYLIDFIPDEVNGTPQDYSDSVALNDTIWELAKQAKLSEREIEVLKFRFGFYDRVYSLEEVGVKFKVTRERIRQIEAKALRKLRRKNQLLGKLKME